MNGLVLSLFPGIGLLDIAFEEEGFCVVRGPDLLWGGDIRRFHPPAGKFDGVIGGPPCQSFSPLIHLVRANGYEPKHGNMIPDYERVVSEAAPTWFLMENVTRAPEPAVSGYAVVSFRLNNAWLGEAQVRLRRFSFGLRGPAACDLRRWIQLAALELPECASPVLGEGFGMRPGQRRDREKVQTQAVTGDPRAVPVAIGGSGKHKTRAVRGKNDNNAQPWEIANGRAPAYKRSWAECCELQGVPADFLAGAPFTVAGKALVLGNGVPLPMGRAIAKAVKKASGQ